jgi:hypothetical protein
VVQVAKVKMRESIASSEGWAYAIGQVVEIDGDLANKWEACGLAEIVGAPEPESAAAQPPETAMLQRPLPKKPGGKK